VPVGPQDPQVQHWTAIGGGLLIGLGAKYAIQLQDRTAISWRDIVIDAMLLAANALMASLLLTRLGWHGQEAMAVAALFGASSDRIVRVVRKKFEERVNVAAEHVAAAVTTVPPTGSEATVTFVSSPDPRAAPIEALREVYKNDPTKLAEFEALLKRLD
jgi:hypothetical protein